VLLKKQNNNKTFKLVGMNLPLYYISKLLIRLSLTGLFCFSNFTAANAQIANDSAATKKATFSVMFYNTENTFDTFNDSLTNDDEFTPNGLRHWTYNRYTEKINNLFKVIAAISVKPPDVIGLCEIENKNVLKNLTQNTFLLKFGYEIIHQESPDNRGIDVGIIYNPETFNPITKHFIRIIFPFDTARRTRDIVYVKGVANQTDTLHIFMNHWPSRSGGQSKSEPYRIQTAKILKSKTDSILQFEKNAKTIIMGDFNDEPDNTSLKNGLCANLCTDSIRPSELYNLSACLLSNTNKLGTHKFNGSWAFLDQAIVSSGLLTSTNQLHTTNQSLEIFKNPFLLKPDKSGTGTTPFRTYNGYRYAGGYSDHLPILLKLFK
jgi:predicted extracellular nuclease